MLWVDGFVDAASVGLRLGGAGSMASFWSRFGVCERRSDGFKFGEFVVCFLLTWITRELKLVLSAELWKLGL